MAATFFSIVINTAFIFKFVCCFKIAMAVTACNYLKNVLQYIKEKLMQ